MFVCVYQVKGKRLGWFLSTKQLGKRNDHNSTWKHERKKKLVCLIVNHTILWYALLFNHFTCEHKRLLLQHNLCHILRTYFFSLRFYLPQLLSFTLSLGLLFGHLPIQTVGFISLVQRKWCIFLFDEHTSVNLNEPRVLVMSTDLCWQRNASYFKSTKNIAYQSSTHILLYVN